MKKNTLRNFIGFIALLIIAGVVYWKYPAKVAAHIKELEEARNSIENPGILAEKNLYSFFWEELIMRDFFQDRQGGFFVDVGCAFPIAANNTYYLEKHLGWTGIGIDALDDYAAEWKEKRPKSKFLTYLVTADSEGSGKFYKSESVGLSAVDEKAAAGLNFSNRPLKTTKIQVKKTSLTDLFDRERIKKIDLLSLDIEGHELEALKGLDLERFSPEFIIAEAYGIRDEVETYLNQRGYYLIPRYAPFKKYFVCFARRQELLTSNAK